MEHPISILAEVAGPGPPEVGDLAREASRPEGCILVHHTDLGHGARVMGHPYNVQMHRRKHMWHKVPKPKEQEHPFLFKASSDYNHHSDKQQPNKHIQFW